ncbi:O-antigen ligase family protein, partial [Patescibacteria group bacterium]|nr:O-antigen ligase family protein [Patescibacteria group bacterium]
FVVWFIKIFVYKEKIYFPKEWRILTALFIAAGTIAVFVSPDLKQALGLWKAYIVEPLLFFIVFINVIKTPEQRKRIYWAFGLTTVFLCLVTIFQYIGLIEIPAHYGFESPKRATGIFPFPTAVGKYLAPIVAMFIGFLFMNKKPKLALLVVICGLLAISLSVSRGALIGVGAAIVFVSFFSAWRKWIWLGLAGLFVLLLLIPQTRGNIVEVFETKDTSTDVRLVMWKGAARIIEDHPIAGTGLASFPLVYDEYKENSHVEYFPNPDNLYLTLWIEMGLAGVLVFLAIVVQFFREGLPKAKGNAYIVGLMAAMVAILIHGFLDTPYFKNDLAIQFWIFIGLMVALQKSKNKI